ncbi:hypothetical protein M5689_020603 [Euphorbia peplus]|nr:hypothetical protein M5689_020603 [Euphorbia peplus]
MRGTRSFGPPLEPPDPEIEKTLKKKKKQRRQRNKEQQELGGQVNEMAGPHQRLMDYATPGLNVAAEGVVRPLIAANQWEIKPALLNMLTNNVTFYGLPSENPNARLTNFLEVCDTFKINDVPAEAIKLRLFPFTLKDRAKVWLTSLPQGSITSWNQLAQAFLSKYFPLAKTARIIKEITSFTQQDHETLYEAWERFKELQRLCPHHHLPDELLMQIFYNGINPTTRSSLDAKSGGLFMKKTSVEARELLEEMAINSSMWPVDRAQSQTQTNSGPSSSSSSSAKGIHSLDPVSMMQAQLSALTLKVDKLFTPCDTNGNPVQNCMDDSGPDMVEQVNFIQGQNRNNNPYSNTYNPGWRNHPNFGWKDNSNANTTQDRSNNYQNQDKSTNYQNQPRDSIGTLSTKIDKFIDAIGGKINTQDENFKRVENKFDQLFKNHSSSIHNLEVQIGQIAKSIPSRREGSLPSNTEENPKEQVKGITLRSGKQYLGPELSGDATNILQETNLTPNSEDMNEVPKAVPKETGANVFQPKAPYPPRIRNKNYDKQLLTFIDKLKNLHINLSFMDAITQIPNYSKFLKDLISKKISWEDVSTIALTEDCSSIVSSTMPTKLKDPGCFTIPCTLGDMKFPNCLCDLGASINLMSLSIFKMLGLEEDVKRISMVLQLADQTIKKPYGIVEDVLVKVDKFIFPTDFVILDFAYDLNCPLIFGRPFMNTGRALVDVSEGKIILRIGDNKIEFNMNKAMKYPMDEHVCMKVDLVDECVNSIAADDNDYVGLVEPEIEEVIEEIMPEPLI